LHFHILPPLVITEFKIIRSEKARNFAFIDKNSHSHEACKAARTEAAVSGDVEAACQAAGRS
jgi:hypothetical protein